MITVTIPFGKHRGQSLDRIPLSYLKWLQNNADLDWWLAGEIKAELARRGVCSVDAGLVLADLEEELYARISEDDDVDFALAGKVSDHVMEACDCSPAAARDRRRDTPAYHTGAKTMPDRERFVLTFETLVSDRPWAIRLRGLLKYALRGQQLKCIRVEQLADPAAIATGRVIETNPHPKGAPRDRYHP